MLADIAIIIPPLRHYLRHITISLLPPAMRRFLPASLRFYAAIFMRLILLMLAIAITPR